jgi:DHA2 family multidrug resistance protein
MLIAARVLQGAVAGPMIPLSQALLLQAYPREKAGMALAMWSMTTLVAPVMGPILGGWLSDNLSGRGSSTSTCRSAWRGLDQLAAAQARDATRQLPIDKVG